MIDQISVVMPTYNAMPFLKAAVESILTQSFRDFELLIVDDGSTDKSKDYLDSLSDPRIRVIHLPKGGLETALNTGIREAKHKWIARMDADDIALPQRFEKQVEFLNLNQEYVLVSCAFGYTGANGRRLKAAHVQPLQSPPSYKPMVDPVILHQGVLYEKQAVLAVSAYRKLTPAEDLDLWLRLDEASYKMASLPDILMLIRVLPGGISSNSFIKQRAAWKYVYACAKARRDGVEEPTQEKFYREHWPRGWRRVKVEGARQFRLGGADWGAGHFLRAALHLSLALLLRPDHVLSKFRIYFFAAAPSAEASNPQSTMSETNKTLTASRTHLVGTKAKEGSLEGFLSELFRGFERERIEYALARDYGPLPASLDTRDLDLLVGEGQLERAYQVVESVAQTHSLNVLRINQESALWLLVISSDMDWGLRVDLATPDSHTWRGVCHLGLDRAFQRKVCESGIYSLRGRDIVFMQFCRDIMGSLKLREKYRSAIRSIYFDNPWSFEVELGKMFGRRCADRLSDVCRKGNFEDLKVLGKQMRRAVIVRGLLREPLGTAGSILRYLGWRCREYVRPNGVMVAVIGPDGSGKGSLIEKVKDFLTGPLHFPPRVYHLRPGLLPSLGSLLLGRKDDGATVTNPHAKKPSGLTFSLLRLAYYTLDYVFGYWLLVRPRLGRKCIAAIFDRYFYDYLFDPARFRISLPPWVVRAFGIFVPKPDLVILLSADPEVVYSRKPELPLNEIQRQFSEIGRFAKHMGNCVYINSCGPLEDSAQDMSGTILSTLEERLL